MEFDTFQAAIQAGQNLTQERKIKDGRLVLTAPHLKDGSLIVAAPKEEAPRFMTAAPKFQDSGAFIAYVNDWKQVATRIFYAQAGKFLAVLDYHQAQAPAPQHGDHLAYLDLTRSPEWNTWAGKSEKPMNQQEFAEFLEDNANDILQPGPAEMLEVATSLHATTGATFRRATNLANGQVQMQFDENIEAKCAGGTKEVPTTFQIGVRPFMGTERYPVDCRLRYRVQGGSLSFHFKTLHLDTITEAALDGIVAKVKDETGIAPALGSHDPAAFAKGT